MPEKERFILCFDNLNDGCTEAIDAYTFFLWLQKHKIPSKYIIHPNNPLAQKIRLDKDIIVSNATHFFINCSDILSKSKHVITSFGLYRFNRYIKKLPWLNYIFIDHGVEWLKAQFYTEKDFNYRLSGFIPTYNVFKQKGLWKNKQIHCSLPRWDNLKKIKHKQKSIFVFFTYRKSVLTIPETTNL